MIGLDLGTTNCKAVLFDPDGRPVAAASEASPLRVPAPGRAESDVLELWEAVVRALRAVAAEAPVPPSAISFSGAMHSCFPVDDDGAPLAPAMTWADNRAAAWEPVVRSELDAVALYGRTGCPVRSTYHPVRLRWWAEEESAMAARAARFVGLKDWILHELTGVWAIDHGLASTTGLLDIARLDWDPEALRAARIAPERLPALVPSRTVVGGLTRAAAAATGLPVGLPVVAGGSDGAMANLGTGAVAAGQTVVTVGTSGAVRQVAASPWIDPEERTWCYVVDPGRWLVGGAINNGGLALEWVRSAFYGELAPDEGYRRLIADAATVPAGSDGVFVLPYFTGERSPSWTPGDPGLIYGLRLEHGRAHVARATMEGVAHCLADVRAALPAAIGEAGPARLTGGITRTPLWAGIVADVLGEPLVAVEVADASAAGAALVGFGALDRLPAVDPGAATAGARYEPGRDRDRYARLHRAYDGLRTTMREQERALEALRPGPLPRSALTEPG